MSPTTAQQPSPSFTLHTTLPLPAKIGQINGIQILRAVAVFLVTWLHAGQALGPWRVVELPHFMAFGIDIFFVISGFIMATILIRSRDTPGVGTSWRFLRRRLIRIFPIYWIFAGLEYARLARNFGPLLSSHLPSFLLLPGLYPHFPLLLGVSWTLVFEMFFYYALASITLFTVKRAPEASILILGGAVLLGVLIHAHNPLTIMITSPILLEFIAGATIALAFRRFGKRRGLGLLMLGLGAIGALYMQSHPQYAGVQGIDMVSSSSGVFQRILTWGISATLIVSGVVFWSPATHNAAAKVAVVLGNASYSAYLLSSLLIEFTARMLVKLDHPSLAAEIVFQFLIVGLVLFAGWLSYQFLEWPMTRWLQEKL